MRLAWDQLLPGAGGSRRGMDGGWPTHLQLLLEAESLGEERVLLPLQLLPLQLLPLGLLVCLGELAVEPAREQGRPG